MCAAGRCVGGVCEYASLACGTVCIQWSARLGRHVAGVCGLCECLEQDFSRPVEAPSS
jgi:hypothetical protein